MNFSKQQKTNKNISPPKSNNMSYAEIAKIKEKPTSENTSTTNNPDSRNKIDIVTAFVNLQKAISQITQMTEIFKNLLPDVNISTQNNQ